jgi:hypothetical protein
MACFLDEFVVLLRLIYYLEVDEVDEADYFVFVCS